MAEKMRPTRFSIDLGNIEVSQRRRAAYEKAAKSAGRLSLSGWAKTILDQAAGFKED